MKNNNWFSKKQVLFLLIFGLIITVACDVVSWVVPGEHVNRNKVDWTTYYYGKGTADTTIKFSTGSITCQEENAFAELKILADADLPSGSGFTYKLTSNENYFVLVMSNAYRAVGVKNKCEYWPEGSYSTVEIHGIFNSDKGQFTPFYTGSGNCPDLTDTTLTKNGETIIADYHCINNNETQAFHFEITPK